MKLSVLFLTFIFSLTNAFEKDVVPFSTRAVDRELPFIFPKEAINNLIANLATISTDGNQCSVYLTDGHDFLSNFIQPLSSVTNSLVDAAEQLLGIAQPLTEIADPLLELIKYAPSFGIPAFESVKYLLRVEGVLGVINPVLQTFKTSVSALVGLVDFMMDGFTLMAEVLHLAADVAGSSAVIASTVVACCDATHIFKGLCGRPIDAFAKNQYVGPVVAIASTLISICPATVEAIRTGLPDLSVLQDLSASFRAIINTAGPFVRKILSLLSIFEGEIPEQLSEQEQCCQMISQDESYFQAYADGFVELDCETAEAVAEPLRELLIERLPTLEKIFESKTFSITLPNLDMKEGIQEGGGRCSLAPWDLGFELKEYSFTMPGLSFDSSLREALESPDPWENTTLFEDSAHSCVNMLVEYESSDCCCETLEVCASGLPCGRTSVDGNYECCSGAFNVFETGIEPVYKFCPGQLSEGAECPAGYPGDSEGGYDAACSGDLVCAYDAANGTVTKCCAETTVTNGIFRTCA